MRLTLPALVLGLLVAQGAMAGDGTAALGLSLIHISEPTRPY